MRYDTYVPTVKSTECSETPGTRKSTSAAAQGDASAKKLYDKYHHRPAEEMYRVDEDPWEMNNLADKPQYAEAKKRLLAELQRWMAEQNDPGAPMDDPEAHAANRKAGLKKPQ